MSAECPICYEDYNSHGRVPRILKECGHTVCETCAEKLLKQYSNEKVACPFDKRITVVNDVDSLPKNYAFLQILDEKEVKKPEPTLKPRNLHCSFHPSEEARFLCTSPDCKVEAKLMCAECMVENGKHEGHAYTSSKKLQERKLKIEGILRKVSLAKISDTQDSKNFAYLSRMLNHYYGKKKKQLSDLYAYEIRARMNQESKEIQRLEKEDDARVRLIMDLGKLNCEKIEIDQAHSYISTVIKSGQVGSKPGENQKQMSHSSNGGTSYSNAYALAKKFISDQEELTGLLSQLEGKKDDMEKKIEQLEKEKLKSAKTSTARINEIKKKTLREVHLILTRKEEARNKFRTFVEVEHRNFLSRKKRILEARVANLTDQQVVISKMMENGTIDEEVLKTAEEGLAKEPSTEKDYIPLKKYQLSLDKKYRLIIRLPRSKSI